MPDDTMTRWTVTVSREADAAVRTFLAERGLKDSDLSGFVEEAVKWRVLDQTIAEVRSKFTDIPPEELGALIDEAIAAGKDKAPPSSS